MIQLFKKLDDWISGPEGILNSWPLPARIVVACFLFSVGIGFTSAMVNLHFQEATPGNLLPSDEDVVRAYHGKKGMTALERLLTLPESLPFNGSGSMRAAFTERKGGSLKTAMRAVASELQMDLKKPDEAEHVKSVVLKQRDGERLAVIAWIRSGGKQESYGDKGFELPAAMAKLPITKDYIVHHEEGKAPKVDIEKIITDRCVRCHSATVGGSAARYPLDKFEEIEDYLEPLATEGKSIEHLALTTHVHLLSFSVLYGLTGILFALTGWPWWIRLILAPAPLVFQVIDISFWWLARLDEPYGPLFAKAIMVSGGLVALSLVGQIVLGSLSLFRGPGKALILVVLGVGALAGLGAKVIIVDPYLKHEKAELKEEKMEP